MAKRRDTLETAVEVFDRMRADHRAVLDRARGMLASAEAIARGGRGSASAEAALGGAVAHLARQFATHMSAEDDFIYPAVERALPASGERLLPLRAEHEELRSMLVELRRTLKRTATDARDEQIEVLTRDMVDLLRIHIRKEEAIVFTLAERLIPPQGLETVVGRLLKAASQPGTRGQAAAQARRGAARPAAKRRTSNRATTKAATMGRRSVKPKGRAR